MTKLSIITPTYKCKSNLANLFNSLKSQTNYNFEWIIVDGESNDGTLDIFSENTAPFNLIIDIKKDFGIYDAINRGILISNFNNYLVLGSDDELFPNAVENIISLINKNINYDFYCFALYVGHNLFIPKKKSSMLYGMPAISSCHSVGLVINKKLHETIGYYSNKFPIASDQYFVLNSYKHGASFIRFPNIVLGKYSYNGVSSVDFIGTLTEYYRIQLKIYPNQKLIQTILFLLRLIKNYIKIK